jgi:hypothetical protein
LWKRTRTSHKSKQNLIKKEIGQADLDMLELAAAAGDIHLKYLDESGFSLWAQVYYTWAKKGEQKRIEQTKKKGKRLNICAFWEINKSFEYGLALKNFNSQSYIKLMDWQAEQAQDRLIKSGIITVIVQDQGSIHTSKIVKERQDYWSSKGLYLFSLPSYCSEMNRIENEWQRIKEDELAGRMFSDEYELAIAVMEGVEARYKQDCYEVKRYHFQRE